jgi:hypothetical protein
MIVNLDQDVPENHILCVCAGRISKVVASHLAARDPKTTREKAIHATIDILLGAIYAMAWARLEGFIDRGGPPDTAPITKRAVQLEQGRFDLKAR